MQFYGTRTTSYYLPFLSFQFCAFLNTQKVERIGIQEAATMFGTTYLFYPYVRSHYLVLQILEREKFTFIRFSFRLCFSSFLKETKVIFFQYLLLIYQSLFWVFVCFNGWLVGWLTGIRWRRVLYLRWLSNCYESKLCGLQ